MFQKLEKLLREKSFSELNAEEKYFVTEHISEAEYGRMRVLLQKGGELLKKTPVVNPALKKDLLKAMRRKRQQPPVVLRMLRYRLPVWQAAAVVLLLLGAYLLQRAEPGVVEKTETVYVHLTDTIYREIVRPVVDTVVEVRLVYRKPAVKEPADNQGAAEELIAGVETISEPIAETPDTFGINANYPKGQPASQSKALWGFYEEVY